MTTEYRIDHADIPEGLAAAPMAAATCRAIYLDKAREAGLVLDPDDLAVLDLTAATAANIADLDASIAALGVVVGSETNPKTNPALTEVRQQRLALARLMAVMDQRISAASGANTAAAGGQHGVRGVYTGNGEQNQQRGRQREQRRVRGQGAGA